MYVRSAIKIIASHCVYYVLNYVPVCVSAARLQYRRSAARAVRVRARARLDVLA